MFTAFVILALAAPADPPKEKELPEAAKKELEKLQGKWMIVRVVDITQDTEMKESELFFGFKGTELSLFFGDKKETLWVAAIDPGTDPKCIDFVEKREGRPDRTLEGVYKIEGDTLRIALSILRDSKSRPAGFDKPTEPRIVVWTFKRVKECP